MVDNLSAMMTEWQEQFGRAAWLPVLAGPQHASQRAAILTALHGREVYPEDASITVFRRDIARAFAIDPYRNREEVDEDILASFHRRAA